jgi:hypothetical protein
MTRTVSSLPAKHASKPLQWILPLVSSEWLNVALKAWKAIRQHLGRELQQGMYEILDYDSMLELKDRRGRVAVLERRQKVRFLQDNIIAYQDQAWGDGELFADYQCSPGVAVDRYRDGLKWNVLISLRETRQRGDLTEFHLSRKIRNGFTKSSEWLQTELSHRTRHLCIRVIFPRRRRCQQALLVERNRNRTTELGAAHFGLLADGRQVLLWETNRPRINELYTIKWQW